MIDIDPREVARYLGYHGAQPDPAVSAMISRCMEEVNEAAEPRCISRRFPMEFAGDGRIIIGSLELTTHSLQRNLAGCDEVFLFAATLGVAVDTLIRRASMLDSAKGLVMQAAAAAAAEAFCDAENDKLRLQTESEGLYLRPRFSPGYGDLSLDCQRTFLRMLNAAKEIGLTLPDSGLMVPIKSVTAIIGISSVPTACHRQGCEACAKTDCSFRR